MCKRKGESLFLRTEPGFGGLAFQSVRKGESHTYLYACSRGVTDDVKVINLTCISVPSYSP